MVGLPDASLLGAQHIMSIRIAVSSVSCFARERPRTFANGRAVIGSITERSRSFANTNAYWTHGKSGFSLLSNLVQKKREMDTIWNERSRVINISWDNLFRNRP